VAELLEGDVEVNELRLVSDYFGLDEKSAVVLLFEVAVVAAVGV
jgi:hypothetical protein